MALAKLPKARGKFLRHLPVLRRFVLSSLWAGFVHKNFGRHWGKQEDFHEKPVWELQYSRISNKKYNLNTWGVKKQKILNTLEQVPDKSNLIDKKLNNYGMLQSHNTTKWGQHIKQTQKYNTILKKLKVESITENNIKGFQKNKLKIEKLNKIYKKNELLWNNRVLTSLSTKFTKIDRKQTNFDKFLYIIKTNTYSHLENTKIKINNANIKIDSVKKANEIFIIKS